MTVRISSFIPARNFTPTNGREIDLIVIHDMESPEAADTAENVAHWAHGIKAPKASWHYGIDSDTIVQSVHDKDVAWHAPGANHNGIGLEHAGRAAQSKGEWGDAYSVAMLQLSAQLTAQLCRAYKIPAIYRPASELLRGQRGITTHAQVTLAFKRGNHTDPGANFPMVEYIRQVRQAIAGTHKPLPRRVPWPLPIPAWFWVWATWQMQGKDEAFYLDRGLHNVPTKIPAWAWLRLDQLQKGRR